MLTIDSHMNKEECKAIVEEAENIVPCWKVNEDSTLVAFLEFDGKNRSVSSICLHNGESNSYIRFLTCICDYIANALKRITREQWNLHTKRVLDLVNHECLLGYTLQLDESTGHLWVTVSYNNKWCHHFYAIDVAQGRRCGSTIICTR